MKNFVVRDIVLIALVAALYVVLTITPPFNLISYGPLQFRVSEMLNVLIFYHRRYIIGITLGVIISDLFNPIIPIFDPIVGGVLQTAIFLSLGYFLFHRFTNQYFFKYLNRAHFYFALLFAFSMFTIAAELVLVSATKQTFFITWFWLFISEFTVILIGSIIFNSISQRIDLRK